MTDLIRRADAIDEVVSWTVEDRPTEEMPTDLVDRIKALPSAEGGDAETNPIPTGTGVMIQSPNNGADDLISRGLAMERIANDNVSGGMDRINEYNNSTEFNEYLGGISDAITTIFCDVPSADITETETCQRCQESIDTVLNRQGERIKALEASAEAVQGWIPVEEQPPAFPCLVCDANGNQPSVPLGIVTITDEEHGEWHIDGRLWDSPKVFVDGESGSQLGYGNRIIAWMPLPKPYKGGEDE